MINNIQTNDIMTKEEAGDLGFEKGVWNDDIEKTKINALALNKKIPLVKIDEVNEEK